MEGKNGGLKLIVYNVSKRGNFGCLIRSAVAFGAEEVFIVGADRIKTFGNMGSALHIPRRNFATAAELKEHCDINIIEILGLEITPESMSILDVVPCELWTKDKYPGGVAVMLGNEGTGMSDTQIKLVNRFFYIPQYGTGTASLNVAAAGAIFLQHIAAAINSTETERVGAKFRTVEPPTRKDRFFGTAEAMKKREERKKLREVESDS